MASNALSLAEAYVYCENNDFVKPLAAYDGDKLVGFIMLAYDSKMGFSDGNYLLFRFMIDKHFQNKGYFKGIMDAVVVYLKTEPAGSAPYLWTSYEPENHHAQRCYLNFGFVETGETVDGELVALYSLRDENANPHIS